MKISIIVPVYNVEGFLRRCLDSCVRQDLDLNEYEIIAVNDGSSDHSVDILKEYASNYKNLTIINKANGGLSSARNAGLNAAKGKYVWFVDSDDWITENCLLGICQKLEEMNLDFLTFEAVTSSGGTLIKKCESRSLKEECLYTGLDVYKSGYVFPYSGAPFYIFSKEFLERNRLCFFEGILFEDVLFTCRMMACAQRCAFVKKRLYFYFIREGSITQSKTTLKKTLDVLKIADLLHDEQLIKKDLADNDIYNDNIALLILTVQTQWVKLPKQDRSVVRRCFFERNYWLDSIKKSRKIKYFLPLLMLKLNIPFRIK